jgi:non-specific serine/threonine protein kinase
VCGDEATALRALQWLGDAYLVSGRYRGARVVLEAAARDYSQWHDSRASGLFASLARACLGLGDLPAAEEHARTSLALAQTIGHAWEHARAWHALGALQVARGDLDAATHSLTLALEHARQARTPHVLIDATLALAALHLTRHDVAACSSLVFELLERVPFAALAAEQARIHTLVDELSGSAPRVRRGTRAERVTRALVARWAELTRGAARADPPVQRLPLSAREAEVAELLAQDLTNRAIAERLGLSPGTVRVHVEHILHKLGLQSRTQVAHWARAHAAASA